MGSTHTNSTLHKAKNAKDDEFYTEYFDINEEMNAYLAFNPDVFRGKTILLPCDDPEWSNFTRYFAQNFELLGLKKLISTSYAQNSKALKKPLQLSLLETQSTKYNETITKTHGKIFTLDHDTNKNGVIDIEDLEWQYLKGDGDFNSEEVKKLRDEADIIITNPPFSKIRSFIKWILDANKKFIIIANESDATNKDIFPLLINGQIWYGQNNGDMSFKVPPDSPERPTRFWIDEKGQKWRSMGNICWLTNIDLKRRHTNLELMSMEDNLRFNKPLIKKLQNDYGTSSYIKYDNYDVLEVPRYDAIPSDYDGVMGVPVTFLKFHNPQQFEIVGCTQRGCHEKVLDTKKYNDFWECKPDGTPTGSSGNKTNENAVICNNDGKHNYFINKNGKIVQSLFTRVFIKRIK